MVGKVIHWELCKKSIFGHTNKWFCTETQNLSRKMRRTKLSVILIYKRITESGHDGLDLEKRKERKRICQIVDFTIPADHRVKLKESEKRDEYLDLA